MQYYELLYIIPAIENIEAVKARVEAILTGQGMALERHEEAGRFRLAYPMRHVRQGVYELALFRGDTRKVNAVETALRLERTIIRAMIARISEAAKDRRIPIAVFEQPVLDRPEGRRTFGGNRSPRRFATTPSAAPLVKSVATVTSPVAAPVVTTKPMSEEEIEHEIDKILEEKVL